MTALDKVDVVITAQNAQSAQLAKIIERMGEHTARLEGLGRSVDQVFQAVREHSAECPARQNYEEMRRDVDTMQFRRPQSITPRPQRYSLPPLPANTTTLIRLAIYVGISIATAVTTWLSVR